MPESSPKRLTRFNAFATSSESRPFPLVIRGNSQHGDVDGSHLAVAAQLCSEWWGNDISLDIHVMKGIDAKHRSARRPVQSDEFALGE